MSLSSYMSVSGEWIQWDHPVHSVHPVHQLVANKASDTVIVPVIPGRQLHVNFHPNGAIYRIEYRLKGKLEGVRKWYYSTGQLGSVDHYHNDRREGECTVWDENGNKEDHYFVRWGPPSYDSPYYGIPQDAPYYTDH
jgi:hypothetical protein